MATPTSPRSTPLSPRSRGASSAGTFTKHLTEKPDPNIDVVTGQVRSTPSGGQSPRSRAVKTPEPVDPITGAAVSSGPNRTTSAGTYAKEQAETHTNVNPITGERIVPTSPRSTSHGKNTIEMKSTHSNVDPILGQPKSPRAGNVSTGAFHKELSEVNANVNPITGDKIAPQDKSRVTAGTFTSELRRQGSNVDPVLGQPKSPRSNTPLDKAAVANAVGGAASVSVNPITGEVIAPKSPRTASAGTISAELRNTHASVNPITGEKVAQRPVGVSHGALTAEWRQQGFSDN